MIYVVLGMHKSGTTLLSRTLHESGINMGDFDPNVTYDKGNKYEREATLQANLDLLNSHGVPSIKTENAISLNAAEEILKKCTSIVETNNANYTHWGFKDPRTCFTLPFWKKTFNVTPYKLIISYRDPLELLVHYKAKTPWLINNVLNAWLEHNNMILSYLQNIDEDVFFLIEYSKFLTDNTSLDELAKFIGKKCKDIRNNKLYRSKAKKLPTYIKMIYRFVFKKKCDAVISQFEYFNKSKSI